MCFSRFVHSSTIHLGINDTVNTQNALPIVNGDDEKKEIEKKEINVYDAINNNAMGRSYSVAVSDQRDKADEAEKKSDSKGDITENTSTAVPEKPMKINRRPSDDVSDDEDNQQNVNQNESQNTTSNTTINQSQPAAPLAQAKDEEEIPLTSLSSYIGETDDMKWWQDVPHKDWMAPKPSKKNDTGRRNENAGVYERLLGGMGIFRYQNA